MLDHEETIPKWLRPQTGTPGVTLRREHAPEFFRKRKGSKKWNKKKTEKGIKFVGGSGWEQTTTNS